MMFSPAIRLAGLNATKELAKRLAPLLRSGDVVALRGDLGTGKTAFARALLQTLGVEGEVPSPTFTLLQTYETTKGQVFHFDLYRVQHSSELDELGWDDALAEGLVIVEWPERAASRLPKNCLSLHFSLGGADERECRLESQGSWTERMKDLT